MEQLIVILYYLAAIVAAALVGVFTGMRRGRREERRQNEARRMRDALDINEGVSEVEERNRTYGLPTVRERLRSRGSRR